MGSVDIVLKTDVEKLGKRGQVLTVKRGFFRNYLYPQGFALEATPKRIREVEQMLETQQRKDEKIKKNAMDVAQHLMGVMLEIKARAGEEGKLFGSVTSQDIHEAIEKKGFSIDRRQILIEDSIKTLGLHNVDIRLHSGVIATIKVDVIAK